MNGLIPTFEYQDKSGKPVPNPADPNWKYTVISRTVRTVKGGVPQQLVDGEWIDIRKA
jgi:hypothetical protein